MNPKQKEEAIRAVIKRAEDLINKTLWEAVQEPNPERELQGYLKAQKILEEMPKLSSELEKVQNRVLSYCLMRIDNALVATQDVKGSVDRMRKALSLAQKSEDEVQIARCSMSLGARLASAGLEKEAEDNWKKALDIAKDSANHDMRQVIGWTLIAKSTFLNRKGESLEALELLRSAETELLAIENYAGLANVNALMAEAYGSIGDKLNKETCLRKSQEFMKKARKEKK